MPPPECSLCGKWARAGGSVCRICRTLDRICAVVRSPQIPETAGEGTLSLLRETYAQLRDISEVCRGVVPDPTGNYIKAPEEEGDKGQDEKKSEVVKEEIEPAPRGTEEETSAPATSAKAKPPEAPGGPSSSSARGPSLVERGRTTTESPSPEEKREKPKKEKRKERTTRSRSRRRRRRSPSVKEEPVTPREGAGSADLASPVRVEVGAEEVPESEEEEPAEVRRERKRPRSPAGAPPIERRHFRVAPSQRPIGRNWRGPIPAWRREPAPGTGKHFGKNKGEKKNRRNEEYLASRRGWWKGGCHLKEGQPLPLKRRLPGEEEG